MGALTFYIACDTCDDLTWSPTGGMFDCETNNRTRRPMPTCYPQKTVEKYDCFGDVVEFHDLYLRSSGPLPPLKPVKIVVIHKAIQWLHERLQQMR